MYQTTHLIDFIGDSRTAIALASQRLGSAGLQVVQSFDLQVARAAHSSYACPHHGTGQCNCQLVVLLVYEQEKLPVTLIAHGHDGVTHLVFVDPPDQHPDPILVVTIQRALSLTKPPGTNLKLNPHAA
ncbi:MAG TPA: hypothetical protein VLA49_13205 [Anaerolineales bacterium]|nr:hypothetical protein [Anaerolineales bacterium]